MVVESPELLINLDYTAPVSGALRNLSLSVTFAKGSDLEPLLDGLEIQLVRSADGLTAQGELDDNQFYFNDLPSGAYEFRISSIRREEGE